MAWVSPTGFEDPDTAWTAEESAYDENTGTAAAAAMAPDGERWSSFIELTHAELSCEIIRFWCLWDGANRKDVDIDVYYADAWRNVYEGAVTSGEFVEKAIPGELLRDVTAARFRQTVGASVGLNILLYEFDFQVPTAYSETASVIIGTVASASKSWGRTKTATVIIGVVSSASRAATWTRTASVIVGVALKVSIRTRFLRRIVSFTNRKVMNAFTNIRSWINHTNLRS